ncbi:MAG: hypothetical protein Q9170_007380, partial [Blastenia crenularia]
PSRCKGGFLHATQEATMSAVMSVSWSPVLLKCFTWSYTLGEISNQTAEVPYPTLGLNTPSGGSSTVTNGIVFGSNSQAAFISVRALFLTPDDTLWVIDTGRPTINATTAPTMPYAAPEGPKLCSINLTNHTLTKPTHARWNGFIVLDLGTGKSWRQLNQHPSTLCTFEDVPPYQGISFYQRTMGRTLRNPQEGLDGAELCLDGSILCYSPLTSDYLYSFETQYLRVDPATDALAGQRASNNVKNLGQRGGNTNGFSGDSNNIVYVLMPENSALYIYNTTTLQAEPFVKDPSDAIAQFAELSNKPKNVAVDWLKLFDNDLEKTINAYFDDPSTLEKKQQENSWNESQFHSDRGNNASQQPGLKQKSLAEQEEDEIQRAMELSRSQILQKTGTTPVDRPYFGPVRHEYHDTKNWVMTTSKSTAKEILLNPEPKDRKRQRNTPAFLRPSPAGHRLPGVVKILHAIPAAREALLGRGCVRNDYGHQDEWWDGVAIESPRIVQGEIDHGASSPEVIYEGQRLMAFLDDTERAYGSSEALANFPGLREWQGDAVVKGFVTTWTDSVSRHDPAATFLELFQSTGAKTEKGFLCTREDIGILEIDISEEVVEPGLTLYDAIDSLLWPGWDGTESDEHVYLDKVADVLIIRVARGDSTAKGLDVKVPPVWYADRYLQSSQHQVHQMLAAKAAVRNEINELNTRKHKASEFRNFGPQAKPVDISRLLENARQHFDKSAKYSEEANGTKPTETEQELADPKAYSRIAEELKALSDRVAGKLQAFEESKEKARDKLRELSKLFTEPSDVPGETPREKYTLRGVCAEPHTVYVQERAANGSEEDLLDVGTDEWQWWKLNYEISAAHPISRTKVREIEVLKAARDEAPSAFLVYASERAMAVENGELPAPLKSFVQADNRAFAAELASASPLIQPMTKTTNSNNPFRSPQPRLEEFGLPPYRPQPRDRSYDDYIPSVLRQDNLDMDIDEDMMENEGEGGVFGDESGRNGGYRLGSYVPEIRMEEEEEEGTQRGREG